MAKKMDDIGFLKDFVSIILAGIAGNVSTMKSGTINALNIIITQYFNKLNRNFIEEINEILLLLVKEKDRELFQSLLKYFKNQIKILSREKFKECAEKWLLVFLQENGPMKDLFRSHIR